MTEFLKNAAEAEGVALSDNQLAAFQKYAESKDEFDGNYRAGGNRSKTFCG